MTSSIQVSENVNMKNVKKIIIAEDQTLVRQGLRSLLQSEKKLKVIAEAENGIEAIRFVEKYKPHLILLDLAMPKMSGLSAIEDIKKRFPNTKIIALTFHSSEEYILEAFNLGVDGYCLKKDSHSELLAAIESVLSGKKFISPSISSKVLEGYIEGRQKLKRKTSWETLTQREKEVLKLVGEGYSSIEIGNILFISSKTVDKHRSNIMNKLDLHSAAALTAYAMEKGLITT
jgi:DNA-binding NarL/FixJ family response regulator